ncbi:Sterol-binding-like protein [Stigmatella aurantiaca DW4/3-1]|nr:Sterol-binding-like protein [Stigmatella aurantiaca DW4/3-1]
MAALLAESFAVLAREQPAAYSGMCARLKGLAVRLEVGPESFTAAFGVGHAQVRLPDETEQAQVSTGRETVLAVLDGEQSLTQAVLTDAVRVVGPLDTLLRLHEGLVLYVQGAARAPGFAALLRRLREMGSSIA